ncbi:MAG: hypothetical protein ABFS45_11570 [Pseudomonadota bacterium]
MKVFRNRMAGDQEKRSTKSHLTSRDNNLSGSFADNRPVAARQLQIKEAINSSPLNRKRNALQAMIDRKPVAQLKIGDVDESDSVDKWVANANGVLGKLSPDSIIEAELSKAIRLRWYNVSIAGKSYLVGLNIHYGGAFGALWVKNNTTQETNAYHPKAPPQHGLNGATLKALLLHIYEYDPVLHYKATHPMPDDGDWDRQYSEGG